jgi:hypothetical protein
LMQVSRGLRVQDNTSKRPTKRVERSTQVVGNSSLVSNQHSNLAYVNRAPLSRRLVTAFDWTTGFPAVATSTWTNSGWYLLANSPYDPDYGNYTSHQVPAGYWAAKMATDPGFYKRCTVTKVEFEFKFIDSSATPYNYFVGATDNYTAFLATTSDTSSLGGQPMVRSQQANSSGEAFFRGFVFPWDIKGITKEQYMCDPEYSCQWNTVAVKPLYLVFGYGRMDDAVFGSSITQYVNIRVRYHCICEDLVE